MTRRDFWKYLTRVHRWAGLILGIQITLWFASGLFMSLFSIESVRGNHVAAKVQWALEDTDILPIEIAMTLYEGELTGATLTSVASAPVYALIGDQGTQLIDARSGQPWTPVSEDIIRQAARRYYVGEGDLLRMNRLIEAPIEYRRSLPVWQVEFDDKARTRLYISADTAELKAVRTRLWRVYDFMWMLHIMDYQSRDNFNSWWLKLFAGAALFFAISGVLLVVQRIFFRPKRKQ